MIEKFRSRIMLLVKGRNINRFIQKLTSRKINILSLKPLNRNEVKIIIYKDDYEQVMKIKSIYEVLEEDTFGYIKIKKLCKVNRHLIICLFVCFTIFIGLTNMVFDIEVIHSNKEIRHLLQTELENNGIKKFSFKKSYKQLEVIKEKILNSHPDEIEWLEIETKGTKYVVRVEEREVIKNKDNNNPRNIVAAKDGVIKKIVARHGNIEQEQNTYVKKGEVIINGDIMLNDKSMGKVKAEGEVFAEVWYVIKTEYPFAYYEEKETGRQKDVYAIEFASKDFELTFDKYEHKKSEDDVILSHPLLPIKLVKQHQKEVKVTNQILTFDEALIKAEALSIKKMEKTLDDEEYIIRSKYLKSKVNESTIEVEMFFAVYENITDYKEIK